MITVRIDDEQHKQLKLKSIHNNTNITETLKKVLTKALGTPQTVETINDQQGKK